MIFESFSILLGLVKVFLSKSIAGRFLVFFLKTAAFTEHQRVTDTVYTRRMDFRRQLYSRMDLLSYFNRWQLLPIPFQSKKTTLNENFVRETGSDFFAAIRNAHRYRRERIFWNKRLTRISKRKIIFSQWLCTAKRSSWRRTPRFFTLIEPLRIWNETGREFLLLVLFVLGPIFFTKRDGDVYAALKDCYAALLHDPEHVKAHFRLAKCLFDLKQYKSAQKCLEMFKVDFCLKTRK